MLQPLSNLIIDHNQIPYGFEIHEGKLALFLGNETPIKLLGAYGNVEGFKQYVTDIAPHIYDKDQFGITVLHMACHRGNMDLVKYLIEEYGFDPNEKDNFGRNAVHYAVCSSKVNLIRYLRDETGAEMDALDNAGHNPKWYAMAFLTYNRE